MAIFRFVYEPAGGGREEFRFDVDNPTNLDAEALESAGGDVWDSYPGFLDKIGSGNIRARRAMLWVLLRRNDPKLRFSDLVFNLDEFSIDDIEDDEPVGKDEPDDDSTDSPSPQPDSEPSPSS
jgi:hypothetical protein